MAYKTLYRVFRPASFDEVSGQQHITDILKKQVETGKPSHAYLFCGPRGTGKTSTAKIFANALNCLTPRQGNPCGECEVCKSFQNDAFVDIVEIDAASNNGVDNVRDIREKVSLLPAQGKYKVYIIDEVHMLSSGAFNALLKTLEEPPPHAVFILATTEIRKVPATILSRCQKYDFKRITEGDIVARMQFVAEQTGVSYEEEALRMIAAQADGALRDALSIMDQCIAGHGALDQDAVTETMGIADRAETAALAEAVMTENPAAALRGMEQMLKEGVSPHNVLRDLICALSAALAAHVQDAYQCANILRSLEALISVQSTMRYSNVPEAVLSAAVVRAAVNTTDVDTKDIELRMKKLEDRVERLAKNAAEGAAEREIAGMKAAHPEKPPEKAAAAKKGTLEKPPEKMAAAEKELPQKAAAAPVQEAAGQELAGRLQALKDGIAERNIALLPAASVVTGLERRGNLLVLTVAEEDAPLAEMLQNDANQADVDAVLQNVFGESMTVRVECGDAPAEEEDDMERELIAMFGEANVDIKE